MSVVALNAGFDRIRIGSSDRRNPSRGEAHAAWGERRRDRRGEGEAKPFLCEGESTEKRQEGYIQSSQGEGGSGFIIRSASSPLV